MTITVHILTEGFVSPNGRAFLFPLIVHRKALRERGIYWKSFKRIVPSIYDCDILIIDSKFYRKQWLIDEDSLLEEISNFSERINKVYYFDTTDSSGSIQVELLGIVDRYYKSQLLVDRTKYMKPMYGNRPFTDYFHRQFGIKDDFPEYSKPILDYAMLDKLQVSWNSGLADYSVFGLYRMALYMRLPIPSLLRFPRIISNVKRERHIDVQARMGLTYSRETVAWQRRIIREKLRDYTDTNKLSRRQFFSELSKTKVVVSPFGYGEITLKDFEVFLTGGLLFKPDMSSIDTWPNLFCSDETMVGHSWDLSDFDEKIQLILDNYNYYIEIAENGQRSYQSYMEKRSGEILFSDHFEKIVKS